MDSVKFGEKTYYVDSLGFLLDPEHWDEEFAAGMAAVLEIPHGLTKDHWDVIYYIRNAFLKTRRVPPVYQVCRTNGLHLSGLKVLFPTGYQRGACKIAGVTYLDGHTGRSSRSDSQAVAGFPPPRERTYEIDIRGFLVAPEDWDEQFALFKAHELKMPQPLNDRHWQIIYFLRDHYLKKRIVPTVYETCTANNLELEDLERLFPDGYHRGAVKVAGLRVK